MKIFHFIFALYFMALAFTPCSDLSKTDIHDELVNVQQNRNNEHHHVNQNCSPLCVCNCCSSQVISEGFNILKENNIYFIKKDQNSFENSFLKNFPSAIWQPPEMG